MSAVRAIGWDLNFIKISNNLGIRLGPCSKQSFIEGSSGWGFAEPSYTTLNLVVSLSVRPHRDEACSESAHG